MTEEAGSLIEQLKRDFNRGEIDLPAIPELTFRIRTRLYEEEVNFNSAARLIQLDASLTTRLIHIANSANFRGSTKTTDCRSAIVKLGLKFTRNLVTSIALKHAYQRNRHAVISRLVKQAWYQSCKVGAICHVLAYSCTSVDAESAMLAGMIHNIGTLPLVRYLEKHPRLIDQNKLRKISEQQKGQLGAMLLKFWKFDPIFVDVPNRCANPLYDSGGEYPDLADLVLIAKIHAMMSESNRDILLKDLDMMPAYHRLSISKLGPGASLQLLEEAETDIQQLFRQLY
ncbi:HDOD domain-containing protein [Ectothiorhodospiraceae bacterium BW-2]|nr:HDOD domain-containing protein [Ectothiorhodospiraceae bacterium BW-2]